MINKEALISSSEVLDKVLNDNWSRLEACGVQYLGDEPNVRVTGYEEASLKVMLTRQSTYESTRPSMTIPFLYQIISDATEGIFLDRSYLPPKKDLELFEKLHIPLLFGLTTKQPARKFDILSVTNAIIMENINLPRLLHSSGIDLMHSRRIEDEGAPIIIMGGCNARNAEYVLGDFDEEPFKGTGGLVDCLILGAAEVAFPRFLSLVKQFKEEGLSKKEILLEIAKANTVAGFYLPWAYEEHRREDKTLIKVTPKEEYADFIPELVESNYVYIDNFKPFTRDFISWSGGNGTADIEISRGCGARCRFCQEGYTERPYSQRSVENLMAGYREARIYQGAEQAGCYSFNWSHYTEIYDLLFRLYKEFGRVGLISNRIDIMSNNKELLKISHKVGNRHWTSGIEGCSERIRSALDKGATEEQILRALGDAMEVGFTELKMFFMIMGNETPEDIEECCTMLQKLADMRSKMGKTTFIRMSFTPLFSKSFTPLQWQEVMPALNIEADSLRPIVNKCRELGFGFRTSVKRSEIRLANLLEQGDRRLTSLIIKASIYDEFAFYGNVPKSEPPKWEKRLHEIGLTWETFFLGKAEDYTFPWDHLRFGVERGNLYKGYEEWLEAKDNASCVGHRVVEVDDKGDTVVDAEGVPKFKLVAGKCDACGGCPTVDYMKELIFARIDGKKMGKIYRVDKLGQYSRKSNAIMRVKFEIDKKHAGVPKNVWPYVIARAFMLSNEYAPESFNKSLRVTMTQLAKEEKQPVFGIEYCDIGLTEMIPKEALDVEAIQKECRGITILNVETSVKMSQFSNGDPWNTYEINIPDDFSVSMSEISDAFYGIEDRTFNLRKFVPVGKGVLKPVAYTLKGSEVGRFWLFPDKRTLTMRIPMNLDPFQVLGELTELKRFRILHLRIRSLGSFRFSSKEQDDYGDPLRIGMQGEVLEPEEEYAIIE